MGTISELFQYLQSLDTNASICIFNTNRDIIHCTEGLGVPEVNPMVSALHRSFENSKQSLFTLRVQKAQFMCTKGHASIYGHDTITEKSIVAVEYGSVYVIGIYGTGNELFLQEMLKLCLKGRDCSHLYQDRAMG